MAERLGHWTEDSWNVWMKLYDIDLGDNHFLKFYGWFPDRHLNPQYDGIPDVEKYGANIYHRTVDGLPCVGGITFAGSTAANISPKEPTWDVQSWDPLTLSPSLLCHCGDHGFIRNGKWVRA